LITLGLALRLSGIKLEVSEPVLVINDRLISRSELDEFSQVGSYHSEGEGFLDAIIARELLIQEAVKLGIHEEEAFRKSIEEFYEQSLVKALVDRKFRLLAPDVTGEMVSKYQAMCLKAVGYTKAVYENEASLEEGKSLTSAEYVYNFEDLSDKLKYSLFILEPGESTLPERSNEGIVVYRLDGISDSETPGEEMVSDEQVREFLIEQGKTAMFDAWLRDVRKNARIEIRMGQ
jgi:hypothetical protein